MPFRQDGQNFHVEDGETIAVLSDLHGNADALEATISQLRHLHHRRGIKQLVILGDLFTYGCRPRDIVDQLLELAESYELWLIIGNHDEWYFDSLGAGKTSLDGKPGWIRETIDWTRDRLVNSNAHRLDASRIWHRELHFEDVLLSHANPFEPGDWTYLNDDESRRRAVSSLADRGCRIGVFGHTHRRVAINFSDDASPTAVDDETLFRNEIPLHDGYWLLNPGSIGQPREYRPRSSFLLLRRDDNALIADYREVDYDPQRHVEVIQRTELSDTTKQKLIDYLISSDDAEGQTS